MPEEYSEYVSLTREQAEKYMKGTEKQLIRPTIASFYVTEKVLEVGCGAGLSAHHYPPEAYTGVDISPELINRARIQNPKHCFSVMNAEKLRFKDGYFDMVFCKSVMEHLPSDEVFSNVYSEMLRVSKNKVLMAFHTPPIMEATKSIITKCTGHFGKQIYQNRFAFGEIKRMTPSDFKGKLEIRKCDIFDLWIVRKE